MDLLERPVNPNKHLKEEFVSNLTGSSMLEIAALSTIFPALIVLRKWSSFCRVNGYARAEEAKKDDNLTSCRKDWRSFMVSLVMDYFCVVLPILSIITSGLMSAQFCSYLSYLSAYYSKDLIFATKRDHRILLLSKELFHHTEYLWYVLVVVTCLCILAVDFKIFPRRYAKTETYGTGLMDLGVGSFVVVNSLVSKQARNFKSMSWTEALLSVSPLVFLGFARLISTRGIDYQVHVGEYGVHWNFFFTLAAVSILTSFISIHPKYCGIFGVIVLTGYQACLLCGLSEYLISNERNANIISANKEGLFSIFGYWGMYLVGVYLGYRVFFENHSSVKDNSIKLATAKVWAVFTLFWFSTIILDNYVERVSRRTCNLAYVTLVFAQNFQVLSILTLAELAFAKRNLVLEDAFNQNLLGSFLLANILTGMVNLSVDTLSASSITAFTILIGYSFVLSVVVGLAWFYGLKVKFW
ncbi:uncharacterized protein At4g17910 isoform X2 [Typha angustifolia]|uniref:uncharacterized protein At4g17910 isoform X2 n=1 Tax=Typha angustifolia TaxID=59011 RepID=UPI003C2F5E41